MLDITKAKAKLGWKPRLNLDECIALTSDWYKKYNKQDVYDLCIDQIHFFNILKK